MNSIPLDNGALDKFIQKERTKITAYLRKNFTVSDYDVEDIYQESSLALYTNIRENKLSFLTSSLATYFLRICINQAMTFCRKKKRVVPMINESSLLHNGFLDERLEDLYSLTTADESEEYRQYAEAIVDQIVESLPETCRNIFEGYYWQCLTTKAIADMFGYANANTVKAQKYKCVDKFKKKYKYLMNVNHE